MRHDAYDNTPPAIFSEASSSVDWQRMPNDSDVHFIQANRQRLPQKVTFKIPNATQILCDLVILSTYSQKLYKIYFWKFRRGAIGENLREYLLNWGSSSSSPKHTLHTCTVHVLFSDLVSLNRGKSVNKFATPYIKDSLLLVSSNNRSYYFCNSIVKSNIIFMVLC